MADDQTANVALRDSMVRHQIQLQRFSAGVTKQIHGVLNDTEDALVAMVKEKLADSEGLATPSDVRRLNDLLKSLTTLRETTFDQLDSVWNEQLTALATAEPSFIAHQLDTTSPVVLDLALPAIEMLKSLVSDSPFEGRTLSEWASTLADSDIARMESQIRLGMTAGEDTATIARRLVGSAKLKGLDGVAEITRRNAQAITRTAVNHIANKARAATMALNTEVVAQEVFTAVLDERTTMICASEDGNIYAVNEGPQPPLHWNCRSLRVPSLDGTLIGNRPAKATTTQQVERDFAKANNLDSPTSRDDLPRGLKGKYDTFSRNAINDATGQVPAATNYQDWLTTQSSTFQDDILGATKGQLFRDGGLTLSKFVAADGSELTLSQLATKQSAAFRAAGLDPGDFK
jgi:SPP1 gp7 family putative phage head morphogenesis protein